MKWAIVPAPGERCGGCSHEVPAGEPVALLTVHRIRRCVECTERLGFPFDPEAVAAVRAELAAAATTAYVPPPPVPGVPAPRPQFPRRPGYKSWSSTRPSERIFDPRAAQLGRDE